MTKKARKNKKNKNKFVVQKPLEGRTLPNIFNPDGTLNKFYKKSGGGVSEGIKNIQAKGMKDGDTVVVDGKRIPVIKPESEFIKRKPTKKEIQEDRAKNRPSRKKPLGKVGKKTGDMILSPKADLDGDGMFSEYEKKRGMAVQKAMAENSKPVKVAQASKGGGIAIRGTKFKGVF